MVLVFRYLGLCTGRPGADAGEWKRYTSRLSIRIGIGLVLQMQTSLRRNMRNFRSIEIEG